MSSAFQAVSDYLPSPVFIPEPRLISPRTPQVPPEQLLASIYQRLSLESILCQELTRNLNPMGYGGFPVAQLAPISPFPLILQQNLLPVSLAFSQPAALPMPTVCPVPALPPQPWVKVNPDEQKPKVSLSPKRKIPESPKKDIILEDTKPKLPSKFTQKNSSLSSKEIQNSLISATAAVAASVVLPPTRCNSPPPVSPSVPSLSCPGSPKEETSERNLVGEAKDEKPDSSTPYICPFVRCGLRFSRRFSLMRHMKKHMGYSPFVCPFRECGKRYAEASTLKRHLRVHTGEKPYICQYKGCTKRFGDPSNLKRHELIHSGKKPYKCPHPDCKDRSGFTRGNSLRQHMVQKHRFEMDDPIVLDSISLRYKRRRLEREEEEQRLLQSVTKVTESTDSSSPSPSPFVAPPSFLAMVNDQMLQSHMVPSVLEEQSSSSKDPTPVTTTATA